MQGPQQLRGAAPLRVFEDDEEEEDNAVVFWPKEGKGELVVRDSLRSEGNQNGMVPYSGNKIQERLFGVLLEQSFLGA